MTSNSAGNDIFSSETKIVKEISCELIRTNLQMQILENHHGEIFGRYGLALNFRLTIYTGIIDSEFRGFLCVVVFNNDYKILSGARTTQILIKFHEKLKFIEVSEFRSTERDLSGF